MFIFMYIAITVGSLWLEYKIVSAIPRLAYYHKTYVGVNLVVSLLMSWGLGKLFPAAGMVIAGAAVTSTILSLPMWEVIDWWHSGPQQAMHDGVAASRKLGKLYTDNRTEIVGSFQMIGKVFKGVFYVLLLPFKILSALNDLFNRHPAQPTQ